MKSHLASVACPSQRNLTAKHENVEEHDRPVHSEPSADHAEARGRHRGAVTHPPGVKTSARGH